MIAAFSRYRPRVLTLAVFFVVAAVLVLANLSTEISDVEGDSHLRSLRKLSGGWPLTWHRCYIILAEIGSGRTGWQYSRVWLAGNLAICLVLLAAPVAGCEWLLRCYRPRLRWSLRTMLVAVGLVAAFCGWLVAARTRASLQDPIIAANKWPESGVVLERWGPQWLDFLGADPYRRYIVGAKLGEELYLGGDLSDEDVLEHLKRLSQLPTLRHLSLAVDRLTPAMTDTLNEMPQLQVLSVAHRNGEPDDDRIPHECLAAIGELTQLEELSLGNMVIASESLECLENLGRLRSLRFDGCFRGDHGDDQDAVDHPPTFGQLPLLPQLEELDLDVYDVDDRDLRRIAALPRLKSLKLVNPEVTREGLAELGALKSLEELAIHDQSDDIISAAGLESLIKVMHLKKLHLDRYVSSKIGSKGIYKVTLDNGGEIAVPASEANAFLRALKALREAKPGIVIDNRDYSQDWGAEEKIPWYAESSSDYLRSLPQLPPGAFPQIIPAEGVDAYKSLKW